MNTMHPNISKGIIQCISKLKEDQELEDFKVKVEGDIFSCHSLILASCSEFFKCLLRTDMKEKREMGVELQNISSQTFQLILNSLYTGCELLTKENVLEVWSAVHQLQIQFLIEHCEDLIVTNLSLSTLDIYKQHAEIVQSERICKHIFDFMCTHFEAFRKTKTMLELNGQELMSIMKSDILKVSSEDEVLFAIFDWASYEDQLTSKLHDKLDSDATTTLDALQRPAQEAPLTENLLDKQNDSPICLPQSTGLTKHTVFQKDDSKERKKELLELVKVTRYCLASDSCIKRLYEHKLTQNNTNIKDIFFKALYFKCSINLHEFRPPSAIYRNCSNLRHVGVYNGNNCLRAFDFQARKWFSIPKFPTEGESTLRVYNRKLYACIQLDSNRFRSNPVQVCHLVHNRWANVTADLNIVNNLLTSNDTFIYCFTSSEMVRFDPNYEPLIFEKFDHNFNNINYTLSFHNKIVVFTTIENNRVEETAVHCWNTETHVWTQLDNLDFSSKNMTSFLDNDNTYILDCKGSLWKLTNTETIEFTYVAKLWSVTCDLKGAALFRETLYLVIKTTKDIGNVKIVYGIFSSIKISKGQNIRSNFIHHVISIDDLTPLQERNAKCILFP